MRILQHSFDTCGFTFIRPGICITHHSKNENYFGVVTTTNENIWYSEDYDNLKLISFLLPIKSNDAQLLIKSSDKVLLKTKYTDSPNFAVDGVRYIFGNSSKSGTLEVEIGLRVSN